MGKPVRSLKILARHEASLRRTCRRLARDLVRACAGLPHTTSPRTVDELLRIAAELEASGSPIKITKPCREQ